MKIYRGQNASPQKFYQKSRIGHLDDSYNITPTKYSLNTKWLRYSFNTVTQKLPTPPMKHFVCVVP